MRFLLRSPLYALTAVLTLALGVAAATGVFSVLHSVLFAPLPYPAPDRLVTVTTVRAAGLGGRAESFTDRYGAAPAEFAGWRREAKGSFEEMAAWRYDYATITGVEQPVQVTALRASGGWFATLGVPARLGRTWTDDDCRAASPPVMVLTDAAWQKHFGGDRAIIGRTVPINGQGRTVIGVMPPSFKEPLNQAEVFLPLASDGEEAALTTPRFWTVFARLRPGVALPQAQAEMEAVFRASGAPDAGEWRPDVWLLREGMTAAAAGGLWLVGGAAGCLLLIAGANLAGLTLVRAESRRHEWAVRAALGAGRRQLVRHALGEAWWIGLAAALLGGLAAWWMVEGLRALLPAWLPRTDEVAVRPVAWVFAGLAGLGGALVAALLPVLQWRPDVARDLQAAGRAGGSARAARLRRALVAGEIALALVLVAGAGLTLRTFAAVRSTELGLRPDNVLALVLSVRDPKYSTDAARADYYAALLEKARALPGVTAATLSQTTPFSWGIALGVTAEGRPSEAGKEPQAFYDCVDAAFFTTLSVPLRAGRGFTGLEEAGQPLTCVVSEALARRIFPGEDPLGRRVVLSGYADKPAAEIVGVAADVKRFGAQMDAPLQVYVPFRQRPWPFSTLLLRSAVPPDTLAQAARRAIWSVNPDQPVSNVVTLTRLLGATREMPRMWLALFAAFAALALALAAVGVYGVTAYGVNRRRREFGVRLALGARGRDLTALVLREGLATAGIGVAVGLLAAAGLGALMSGLLYRTPPQDPPSLLGGALLLTLAALAAALIPARRAARTDPNLVLRAE